MKNIKTFVTITTLLFSLTIRSQNGTFIGFEIAATNDKYENPDSTSIKLSIAPRSLNWGITIQHDLNDYFSFETGIIRKYYNSYFEFSNNTFLIGEGGSKIGTWQIPIRLKSKIKLVEDKMYFTTTIGYHLGINSEYGNYGSGNGFTSENGDTLLAYSTKYNYGYTKTFSLLETGVGLEIKVFNKVFLRFSASYFTGFKKVIQFDLHYKLNEEPEMNAKTYSKGEYRSFGVGFRYPIGGHQ